MVPEKEIDEFNNNFNAWLRIEPRCRQDNFAQGIQARIADPLWILARQWQTGEFIGEDAGSPIQVAMHYSTQSIDNYKLGDEAPQRMPEDVPLETLVEQELDVINYRERVRIGQEFERRLRANLKESAANSNSEIRKLIVDLRLSEGFPVDTTTEVEKNLDRVTQRYINFMRNRVVDGKAVLDAPITVPTDSAISQTTLDDVRKKIIEWHGNVCHRPSAKQSAAWQTEQLNYKFEVNTDMETTTEDIEVPEQKKTELVAYDYRNGSIDWFSFNAASSSARGFWQTLVDDKLNSVKTTPTRIEVAGCSSRWWAFENGSVNFGAMDVAKPDLAKLLIMEFALIYGDDWFSVPASVAVGSLVKIDQLSVRNVFGEDVNIEPARRVYPSNTKWEDFNHFERQAETQGSLINIDQLRVKKDFAQETTIKPVRRFYPRGTSWQEVNDLEQRPQALEQNARFDLFTLSGVTLQSPSLDIRSDDLGLRTNEEEAKDPPRPILISPPLTGFRQESPVLDEVRFLRDEGANMVWAVEQTVMNGLGRPVPGFEAQLERVNRNRTLELDELETLVDLLKLVLVEESISDEGLQQLKNTLKLNQAWIDQLKQALESDSISDEEQQELQNILNLSQARIEDLNTNKQAKPTQNSIPQYRLATTVPENWIPFLPIKEGNEDPQDPLSLRAIDFRRAQLLRNTDHAMVNIQGIIKPPPVPAMSRLLALDDVNQLLLIINEETISRAGLRVQLTKQRVRWIDGSTHVWLGKKVLMGRGEGSSGLRFDIVRRGRI